MADLSQIRVGETIYDIKDADARNRLTTLEGASGGGTKLYKHTIYTGNSNEAIVFIDTRSTPYSFKSNGIQGLDNVVQAFVKNNNTNSKFVPMLFTMQTGNSLAMTYDTGYYYMKGGTLTSITFPTNKTDTVTEL